MFNDYNKNTKVDVEYKNKVTPISTPVRDGYTFEGWAKSQTAAKADYKAGAKITVTADTTLYAVWKVETIKITQQPADVKTSDGSRAAFKVKATGSNLPSAVNLAITST